MRTLKKTLARSTHLSFRIFVWIILIVSLSGCSLIDVFIDDKMLPLTQDVFIDDKMLPLAQDALYDEENEALHFFVVSDWGFNGSSDQRAVADQMNVVSDLVGLDFIVTAGDNFQDVGVKSTDDLLWETNYKSVYTRENLNVPWYPALGNHDYKGSTDAQTEYSSENEQWNMPARYYTFVETIDSVTSVRFIMMDTPGLVNTYNNLPDKAKYDTIAQYRWLSELLSESLEKWIIVIGHYPMYSANMNHGDTEEMKTIIRPLFEKYQVDFYISGHDHNFEHAKEDGEYTDYIVTGTSGGNLRTPGHNSRTIFSVSDFGFTYISLSQNMARLCFVTDGGEVRYSFEKIK